MEHVCDSRNHVLPSPSFVLVHGKKGEFMTFCPMKDQQGEEVTRKVPPELQNKDDTHIQLGCDTWLIVWTKDERRRRCRHFLWDANTMEDPIYFPELKLKAEHEIIDRILTAPPGNPDCMLVVFEKTENGPSLSYCREGDKDWTDHLIGDKRWGQKFGFCDPVMFDGKIYCLCMTWDLQDWLVEIDIKKPGSLHMNISDYISPFYIAPSPLFHGLKKEHYMVESCGKLFLIYLDYYQRFDHEPEMLAVELFELDPLKLDPQCLAIWEKVESFEDMAFFVSPWSKFSCPAMGTIIKGNHIYFNLRNDYRVYAFNMKARTSMIMSLQYDKKSMNQEIIVKQDGTRRPKKKKTIEGDFGLLPFEMLIEIGRRLQIQDYMNFRSVNTMCKMAAPLSRWTKAGLELEGGLQGGSLSSPPLLMSPHVRSYGLWNFIDPLHKVNYFLTHTKENELENPKISCIKGGWCLVVDTNSASALLWNPFSKKSIPLPLLPLYGDPIACSFFSVSGSPESDCKIILGINYDNFHGFNVFDLGKWWQCHFFKFTSNFGHQASTDNGPIFYKGAFYLLGENGNVGVYEENGRELIGPTGIYHDPNVDKEESHFEVLDCVIDCPCESFHRAYLLECDDKLLSIFVSFSGHKVQVFELDESNMAWNGKENLENYTIYLARCSSFSTTASPGMQNRIYFPRYYGKRGIVYYSLESRMLHSDDTGQVLDNFYVSEEQVFDGWITPTF